MHEGDNIMLRRGKIMGRIKTGIETKEENNLMGEIKRCR